MGFIDRVKEMCGLGTRPRHALALAGGGVIGGMWEVGALTALEERLGPSSFDVYVGCSAGSVVASVLAGGVPAAAMYQAIDEDRDDPLNFRRGAVYESDSLREALFRFGRLVWAVGKSAVQGRESVPDILARAGRDMPSGFFSLDALERHMRNGFTAYGLSNVFAERPRRLLIPAVELDTAERVVFGTGALRDVPISQAIAASSAIPGFFDPYPIGGRDYVDGGVGWSGHADLAAETGAEVVLVVNPLVPARPTDGDHLRTRGVYSIMEQAGRIASQNLLRLGLDVLAERHPRTTFYLLQPPVVSPLSGPSMGFDSARASLRFGYESTKAWLMGDGGEMLERFTPDDALAG
ncbi:MAG: patatin-like phospholipase family protein [Candidatus Binatia bacterium]